MNIELNFKSVIQTLQKCKSKQQIYQKLLELGQTIPSMSSEKKIEKNLVSGCQSKTFIHTEYDGEFLYFEACSDALITAGLVHLLLLAYHNQPPKKFFTEPPHFLKDLGILSSLSMNRSNGVINMINHMKKQIIEKVNLHS